MKGTAILRRQYHKRTGRILDRLDKPVQKWTPDDFHIIRMEIKKLMAILTLVKACNQDFHLKKRTKNIKALYASAGEVRELQLQLEFWKNNKMLETIPGYADLLTRQLHWARDAFRQQVRHLLKNETPKTLNVKLLTHYLPTPKTINTYLNRLRSEIEQILRDAKSENIELHTLRKKIKDLLFLERFLFPSTHDNTYLEQLQEKIGIWHDGVMMHTCIENAIRGLPLDPNERIILENQRNQIVFQYERLHQEIKTLFSLLPLAVPDVDKAPPFKENLIFPEPLSL